MVVRRSRALQLAHAATATSAVAWAFTSYKNNWLNIGGGAGDVNFWLMSGDLACWSFVACWCALLVVTKLSSKCFRPDWRITSICWGAAVLLPPAVMFTADWLFHLGFPPPPPM